MPDRRQEEFDLRIRSMLSDAGMKPSRRAWKDVSRRLDAGAAAVPASDSWGWARWAGVCLAAAAAIAAGVFLFDPIPTYHNIQEVETTAQLSVTEEAEPVVSVEQPAEQDAVEIMVPAREAVAQAPAAAGAYAAVPESDPVQESAEEDAPVTAVPAPVEEKIEDAQSLETGKTVAETFDDPFARMAWEDNRHSARPVRLYLGGSLGGNDSDFTSTARVSRLSSSIGGVTQNGITELGESSFGIPFTLGLGVRFYLAPRFSIGTGIDYSLLTRSFEGRYNNVNGGIIEQTASGTFFHAMHYIGIPVNAYYDFVSGQKVKFYGYAGAAAEYCIANKYNLYSEKFTYSEPVKGLQWSAGAGLGVEFKLTDFLGVYVDPGARYYFESRHPRNVRTEHPVLFNLDAGFRFDF